MLRSFSTAVSLMALLATAATAPLAQAGDLCALPTASLEAAVSQYADSAFAIEEVKKHAIATWYTDRMSVEASQQMVRDITKHCDDDSRMTLVVYGLPNKDCDAGYSTGGFNHNVDDYKKWLQTLADGVGQRKVLYVLEPDAVGLLAKGGCGVTNGYEANVKMALEMLTQNPNADVYLDVGYWTLFSESDASGVAKTVKTLAQAGRLKGISLNTSNYRSNKQISELCGNFQKAYGDNSLHCIVDTSRNYNENPPSSEWCNAKFGGVGRPPSSTTGFDNLDYFIWIKPAGESDGSCEGGDHTSDAMKGPDAGSFFKDHFVELWNNGYFVKEKNMPAIDGSVRPTSSPVTPSQTPEPSKPDQNTPVSDAPVSQSPVTTTPAPASPTPEVNTSAPISQSPDTKPTPSGELCALPTASLEAAVSQYADSAFAIEEVKKHAIATWYTDRMSVEASQQMVRDITKHCDADSRMTLVVYGLPNKDCDAGYSTGGFNHNVDDYKKWLQTLADGVGQRKVLYVLEPDAVGLLAKGGCGVTNGYEANVKMALEMLTQNPNADVYLDVGYWTLFSESDASGVAKTVKTLAQAGRLKGISLNTSNYRSNKQISELCGNFQKAYGDNSLHCIVDTSRNYNENPPSSEWCNAKFGGVGRPPSSTTGFDNLDYFIWIKPAGESDGSCEGGDHTSDAMKGPDAGSFFKDHFVELWNNGYFVKEKNMPAIDGSVRPTSAPVSQSPVQTTPAPVVSQSPDATTWTPAPQDGNAGQYPVKPRTESREIDDPASTPAPTRKRRSKKCKSDLADGEADIPAGAVKPASDAPMPNISSKSISFAALDSDGRTAPEAQASGIAADQATTQATAPVLPVGAIAAIVVAGVMAIAIAGVALRRRLQHRSEDPTRPSVDTFRDISVTPAGITVL